MLAAGKLRTRLVLEQRSRTGDGAGGSTDTWTALDTVWANVRGLSAREALAAAQKDPEVSHTITIRYRTDVSGSELRARIGTRLFDLAPAIDDEERHEFLTFAATEVRA